MSILYNKKIKKYVVIKDGTHFVSYSEKIFGKYAKLLAYQSEDNEEKYKNYYEHHDDYVILKLYSATFGYFDVYIDTEDYEKIKPYRWRIFNKERQHTCYCYGKMYNGEKTVDMALHRFVLDYKGKDMIDHIDGYGLNNRKSNLRIVDNSTNLKNQKNRIKKNKLFPNVIFIENNNGGKYKVSWRENNRHKCKYFSVADYGKERAFDLAKRESIDQRKANGYIVDEGYLLLRTKESVGYVSNKNKKKSDINVNEVLDSIKPRTVLHLRRKKDKKK